MKKQIKKRKSKTIINPLFKNKKEKIKAFTSHKPNGFFLQFPNGNTLSTVWGPGTYTDNYDLHKDFKKFAEEFNKPIEKGSNTAETMPGCSTIVKKLLDATFPKESNGSIFAHMSFTNWLKMVNILNENV